VGFRLEYELNRSVYFGNYLVWGRLDLTSVVNGCSC
jgi:hypothetical protein